MKKSILLIFIQILLVYQHLYAINLEQFKEEFERDRLKGPQKEIELAERYLKSNDAGIIDIDIFAYAILARSYANLGNGRKTIEYADKGLKLATKEANEADYFNLLTSKSIGLHLLDLMEEAENLISDVIKELKSKKMPRMLAIAYFARGRIQMDQDRHGGAVEDFLSAYKLIENKNDPIMESTILIDLSQSLMVIGDLKNAIKHIKTAAAMPYLKNRPFSRAVINIHLADKLIEAEEFEEANKALKIVLSSSHEINYELGLAYAYIGEAKIAMKTNNLARAEEALDRTQKIANRNAFEQLNIDLKGVFFDLYFKKKDLKNMKKYADKIINQDELMKISLFVQRVVKYFEEVEDFKKAHYYNKKLMAIEDQKHANLTKQEIQKMRVQFNSDLLEKENQYLNAENTLLERNLQLTVVGAFFLGSVCFFLILVVNRNKIIKQQNRDLILQKGIIKRKSEDLQSILSNINQGVITIEPSLEINEDHSACLWSLLNISKDKTNFDNVDDFLKVISETEDEANRFHKILEDSFSIIDQRPDNDFHLLPKSVDLGTKLLEIEWRTILDTHEKLQRILVTVNDVTEVRNLERENQREKLNHLQKLEGLANQMTPHFLFNCLNFIDDLVITDPAAASDAIIKLSDFYRYTLISMKSGNTWSFVKELSIAEWYLDLQKIRFGDRLKYFLDYDDVEDPNTIYFPCLVLHTIIENSVKHAISVNPDKGYITVSVYPENSGYILEVKDTGPGESLITSTTSSFTSTKTGLKNTQDRLKHLYGDQYFFEASFKNNESRVKLWFSGKSID